MKKENILGVDVSNETYESLIANAFTRIEENKQSMIVAINPEKIIKAQQDEALKQLLNEAEFQIPDGVGVLIASRLKGGNIRSRVTGVDLMMKLVEKASQQGKSIFLYGAKPGIADKAKQKLECLYPSIQVKGVIDGYEKDFLYIKETINQKEPDILFVALGSPKQEEWIKENRSELMVSIFQGVGGSFDVLAGNVNRAPAIFRRLGLEWFYRLIREPKRWKRQLALPIFLLKVIKNR